MSEGTRDPQELRHAIAVLGASFIGPAREYVWAGRETEARRAWAAFEALGWAVGADDSAFGFTLQYVTLRLIEFARVKGEKHAS